MRNSRVKLTLFFAGCCALLVTTGIAQDIDLTTMPSSEGSLFYATNSGPSQSAAYSAIGDFNGDGIDDFALGSPVQNVSTTRTAGIINVVLGPVPANTELQLGTLTTDNSMGFRIYGDTLSSEIGHAVSPIGDFNGDGLDDFIFNSKINKAYMAFGRDSGIGNFSVSDFATSPTYGLTIQSRPNTGIGLVSGVGDFNGDGLSDVLVASPVSSSSSLETSASIYLIFGRTNSGTIDLASFEGNGVDGIIIKYVQTPHALYPIPNSMPCDFNGDGLMDIVFTGEQNLPSGRVPLMMLTGRASGFKDYEFDSTLPEDFIYIQTDSAASPYGSLFTHGCAGDFNGDGFSDLYLGSMDDSPIDRPNAGTVFVLYGREMTKGVVELNYPADPTSSTKITGNDHDKIGFHIASLGDIDNDGFDDIIIRADRDFPGKPDTSSAYVIYGRAGSEHSLDLKSPLLSDDGFIVGGAADVNETCYSRAGDVDNDGFDDFLISVDRPETSGYDRNSYIVYGHEKQAAVADWVLYGN